MIRTLRMATGVILYCYVSLHLANHVAGLWSLEAMELTRGVVHAIWRTLFGTIILYGAFLVHIGLGFYAIFARKDLRMGFTEVLQLILGLTIPFLLMMHVLGTRGASILYEVEPSYTYVLLAQWQTIGRDGIFQILVLVISWIHGCIGMYCWLRLKPWFAAIKQIAFAYALLLPVLALLGIFEGAREVLVNVKIPGLIEAISARDLWPDAKEYSQILLINKVIVSGFVGLLILVFIVRRLCQYRESAGPEISIAYSSGATVKVPRGLSILEASWYGKIPHASVCGGRGRCSTCRVRVQTGFEGLPTPSSAEQQVLERVGAGSDVRLACQCRPRGPVSVTPLIPPATTAQSLGLERAHVQGEEMEVTVLFVDIRAFSNIAESKLPYDVVFLLNRYFEAMGRSIEDSGGRIDKFIGDSVMALFGIDSGARQGCQEALRAAKQMGIRLSALNATFAHDFDQPLRIGIGIHHGTAVVGEMGYGGVFSLTAVGDTVNTASRLEALSKQYSSQLVVSESVLATAGLDTECGTQHQVNVRGRVEPLTIRVLNRVRDLPRGL